jgi:DNA-binding XRE family transcriptional regulator
MRSGCLWSSFQGGLRTAAGDLLVRTQIIHFGVSLTISLCLRPMASSAQRSSRKQRERTILLDLLRELRTQKGLSQDQMARAIGTKQAFVSKYETGERRLDFLDLVAICEVLNMSIVKFAERFEIARKLK